MTKSYLVSRKVMKSIVKTKTCGLRLHFGLFSVIFEIEACFEIQHGCRHKRISTFFVSALPVSIHFVLLVLLS